MLMRAMYVLCLFFGLSWSNNSHAVYMQQVCTFVQVPSGANNPTGVITCSWIDSDLSGGGGGTLPWPIDNSGGNPGDQEPEVIVGPINVNSSCNKMAELRLADVNHIARNHRGGVEEGDHFISRYPDGRTETWEFMCGGLYCGPTVLKPAPVASDC